MSNTFAVLDMWPCLLIVQQHPLSSRAPCFRHFSQSHTAPTQDLETLVNQIQISVHILYEDDSAMAVVIMDMLSFKGYMLKRSKHLADTKSL